MNRSFAILILLVSSVVYGCRTFSTEETYCGYEPGTETSVEWQEPKITTDSLAQLKINFIVEDGDYYDYLLARLKNIDTDSSRFSEMFKSSISFSDLPEGNYRLDLRWDTSEEFSTDNFILNTFEQQELTVNLGKPSMYISYSKKRKRAKK